MSIKGRDLILKMKSLSRIAIFIFVLLFSGPLWAQEKLTWVDCLAVASANHPDLISAKESIHQSQDVKTITASSLWPQLDSSLSITGTRTNSSTGSKSDTTTYAYGLSGSQLLFDGFKTINNLKASQENVKAAQWSFQFVSSQVRLRLKTAFINLLKAQELIKLTKEIYDIRQQSVDLITKYYNSGIEHKGALLTAQANLAQAEFEIHQANRGLQVAQRSLIKEIGGKKFEAIEAKGDFDISNKYDQTPDLEQLASNNPQLLKLNMQRNAASFDVKSSRGDFWPSVSVIGGAGKSDEHWPPKADSADISLKLSWPLLEGGSRAAQLDQAKSVVRDLEAQQQSLKDSLVLTLEQSWASLEDAIEKVGVEKKFIDAAQERAKISEKQYSVGLITFDNWTIIEDDLVNAKKTFLNTQANALLAESNWVAAQGRNLENAN